jgi:RNA polymerase sigma-32 factor
MTGNPEHRFDLSTCVPMERAEELRCATEYVKTREPRLAERLVTANLRLVVAIAKGFRRPDLDLRDIVQEGNLGLMHAVERFDPERGVKLSSYAAWWIRAYIMKYTIESFRLVKVGTTQAHRKLFFRLSAERRKLESTGITPDAGQLAAVLDVREKDVNTMLQRLAAGETSLDTPTTETGTLGDSLSGEPALRPDVRVEASEFEQAVRQRLNKFGRTLGGRERTIYQCRLVSDEPATLSHLATGFGVTRERTRQIEQRLKGRLRDYLRGELGDAVEPCRAAA